MLFSTLESETLFVVFFHKSNEWKKATAIQVCESKSYLVIEQNAMEKYNRDMTTVWHQYDTYFSIECGKVKSYLENDENKYSRQTPNRTVQQNQIK